jgi:dihydrofolate reductase
MINTKNFEGNMRKIITGMKMSIDGKIEGPDGMADWVDAWSEDYGLTPQIDACVVGGGMYPGYERYWSGIAEQPEKPAWISGVPPTAAEIEWARFAAQTPHYVLSKTLDSAVWPNTSFVRELSDIVAIKRQPGKDIYLMGGARVTASLIDARLVDEVRLILYPLIAGKGKALFETTTLRHALELRDVQQLAGGRVLLIYGVPSS